MKPSLWIIAGLVGAFVAPAWVVSVAVVVWLAIDARNVQLRGRRRRRAALRDQKWRQ